MEATRSGNFPNKGVAMRLASRPPLARIAFIDQEIRKGAWPNASTLSRQLEVSFRTVQRDLNFLRDRLQAPLLFDPKRNGYQYQNASYRLPFLQLSEGELVALFLAERLLQQYRDTPYAAGLASAFRKITAFLPEQVTIDLSHLADVLSFRQQTSGSGDLQHFIQLQRAIRERRQLELLYYTASRDATCRRTVDPYHLASIDGDWYLVAYCHLREDIRMFVPGRIREMGETGNAFQRPADFQIGDYLDAGFRKVRGSGKPQTIFFKFNSEAARYVREKVWHPSQKLSPQKDGGLIVTMKVNHLLEVKRWALSFGCRCQVLRPLQLREEIEAELAEMIKKYQGAC
jgi:predicted DNA-binding transcriptional regulator YafY